jgi:hypothetical protein
MYPDRTGRIQNKQELHIRKYGAIVDTLGNEYKHYKHHENINIS